MKYSHLALLAALLTAAPVLAAPDPSAPALGETKPVANWRVDLELMVLAVPEKEALALLPTMLDEATMPAAWTKLEGLLAAKTARVLTAGSAKANHGDTAHVKDGEEVKYPIEWELPYLVEPPKGADAATKAAAPKDIVAFPATIFESRLVGVEFSSQVSVEPDGKSLTLDVNMGHTRLLRWDEHEMARLPSGEKAFLKVPHFGTMSNRSIVTMPSRERTLLGIHRIPEGKGEMELWILRAWTNPSKPAGK